MSSLPRIGSGSPDPYSVSTSSTTATTATDTGAVGMDAGLASLAPNVKPAIGNVFSPTLKSGDPTQILRGVKDGKLAIDIPMTPGNYKVKGVSYTVEPGTVMTVNVEVKDGNLVPAKDKKGHDTGGGCKVEIKPPIDLPLWFTGNGAYIRDKGKAQAALKADIGGFFDIKAMDLKTTNLADLVDSMSKGNMGGGAKPPATSGGRPVAGAPKKESPLPDNLLQLENLNFRTGEVTLNDKVVDTGAIRIDLAPGSKVTLSGNLDGAQLEGNIGFDSIKMKQDTLDVNMGRGSAKFTARLEKGDDGTLIAKAQVKNLRADVESIDSRPKGASPTDPNVDHLRMGKITLSDGNMDVSVRMAPRNYDGQLDKPQVLATATAGMFYGSGELKSAKLAVKDARGDAEVRLGVGRFQGGLSIGDTGKISLDGDVKGVKIGVKDLQTTGAGGAKALDLHHLDVEGDAHVNLDPNGTIALEVDAKRVDVRVDDYKGSENGEVALDLGRTDVTGSGKVKFSSKDGLDIQGSLRAQVEIDDLKVKPSSGEVGLDFGKGSKVDGELQHLAINKDGLTLKAKGSVDVGLENYGINLPGVTAKGTARVKGAANVDISGKNVLVSNLDATVSVAIDDAKVAPGGAGFNLDAAKGSKLDLNVKGSTISSDPSKIDVKLGAGSKLDATLDSGEVTVEGQKIKLKAGSRARFDITSLDAQPGKPPALKGKLDIDAKIDGAKVNLAGLPQNGSVKVTVGDKGKTSAKISVADVTMTADGKFSATGVRADVGKITGAKGANGVAVGTLSVDEVKKKSASEIAGVTAAAPAMALDPVSLAKSVKSGTFEVEIPVEGRLADGPAGLNLDFKKGTKLKVQLEIQDGKIVPAKTKAAFDTPGDLPAWMTINGAYLDEKNTLRLDIGGMKDFAVPKMSELPTDLSKLVERFAPKPGDAAAAPAAPEPQRGWVARTVRRAGDALTPVVNESAVKLTETRFQITNATFANGKVPIPGGAIDVGDAKLTVKGTPKAATVSGRIQLDGLSLAQDGLAIKTGRGSADLEVNYVTEPGAATVTTEIKNMSIDLNYAVEKRENGDYIHLARGKVEGASLRASARVPLDAKGLPKGAPTNVDGKLTVPKFAGTIQGGRITVPEGVGAGQIEIGRAEVNGSVVADKKKIEVHGEVKDLDAGVKNFSTKPGAVNAKVGGARVQGSGRVDLDDKGLAVDVSVQGVALRGGSVRGSFKPGSGGR